MVKAGTTEVTIILGIEVVVIYFIRGIKFMGFVKQEVELENYLSNNNYSFDLIEDKEYLLSKDKLNGHFKLDKFSTFCVTQLPNIFDALILNVEQYGRKIPCFGYKVFSMKVEDIEQIKSIVECYIINSNFSFVIRVLDNEITIETAE